MSIEVTYKDILVEDFIKSKLQQGVDVRASDVEEYLVTLNAQDYSVPQFKSSEHLVQYQEHSSVAKFKNTFVAMRQDLRTLYKEMLALSDNAIRAYERWNVEASVIEKELIDLEDRLDNLLLVTQDTDGYFSTIVENFTDTSLSDLNLSSCMIDLRSHQATLQPTGGVATRIFLNSLDPDKDVSFRVRSVSDLLGRIDMPGTDIVDVFKQGSKGWWTSISASKANPLTCELDVHIGTTPTEISKITLELHDSSQSGPIQITPLYTVDGTTWIQVPSNTFTQEARTSVVFSFPPVQATWIKFLLTKKGPDPSMGNNNYSYQFGFKEIAFFKEGFVANVAQQLLSRPLYVIGTDGQPEAFSKLTLQVCERVETGTQIKYYITTSNVSSVPVTSETLWLPIAPVSMLNPSIPSVLDVGELTYYTYGETDDEVVVASYQGLNGGIDYTNPAQDFHMLSFNGTTSGIDDNLITATAPRYGFKQSNDRILNYQLDSTLSINESSFQLFRNIGKKGLDATLKTSLVRDVVRGWGFADPYYYCVVEILASEGIEMNVGDKPIIIDDVSYTGKIGKEVLTGQSKSSTGIHYIKVHKDNWYATPQGLNSLEALKAAEGKLYPYNHKLLIEGYDYGISYPATAQKVYRGVDIFAQYLMKPVKAFDFIQNVGPNQYNLYAKDIDAPGTYAGGTDPATVFLFKVNDKNPDFQNERFVIRFKLINQLQKYLRLRADLTTTNAQVTPALASYKIKLG